MLDAKMPTPFKQFKEESLRVRQEIREKTVGYIVTALGLVAGLAWNEAIKAIIEYVFPLSQESIWAKLIYAALITLMVVISTLYLVRFLGKKVEKDAGK